MATGSSIILAARYIAITRSEVIATRKAQKIEELRWSAYLTKKGLPYPYRRVCWQK
jgi:hypothetical protein